MLKLWRCGASKSLTLLHPLRPPDSDEVPLVTGVEPRYKGYLLIWKRSPPAKTGVTYPGSEHPVERPSWWCRFFGLW